MRHPIIPKYLNDLIDCDDSDFLLTDDINKLDLEIYSNCIYIFLEAKELADISASDIELFIADLKADRKRKLIKSNIPVDLIYYIWFDEMAGQLRLNFINSNHQKLPFGAQLIIVDTEKEIIEEYLNFDTIESQLGDTSQVTYKDNQPDEIYRLKVYKEIINRK